MIKVETLKQMDVERTPTDPSRMSKDLPVPTKTKITNELKPVGVGSLHL